MSLAPGRLGWLLGLDEEVRRVYYAMQTDVSRVIAQSAARHHLTVRQRWAIAYRNARRFEGGAPWSPKSWRHAGPVLADLSWGCCQAVERRAGEVLEVRDDIGHQLRGSVLRAQAARRRQSEDWEDWQESADATLTGARHVNKGRETPLRPWLRSIGADRYFWAKASFAGGASWA